MTKRKPVLVLFIIAAVLLIAGVVLFALPTMITPAAELQVSFLDLNKGILGAFQGQNMATNIATVAISAVVFIIIPLIVHIKRKQNSVTVILLLGALVVLYVDLLLISYSNIKADLFKQIAENQEAMKKLITDGLVFVIGLGAISLAGVLELVIFIVDMCIRVKKAPEAVPTAQEMRSEELEEEENEEEEPAPEEPAQVVAAPVQEEKVEEKVEEPAPEEEKVEEPAEEPEQEEEEEEAEEEPAPAPAPEKKAPAKKAASKKPAAKKAPAKKAEKKPAAKKAEPKKASRETTTIKKPVSETQTIKKAEVLTNDEGKQFVKAYHVSQRKELNKWQVKGAGSEKALKLFDTQKEAIEYANQLSANNGAAVRVHSRAGKMRKA